MIEQSNAQVRNERSIISFSGTSSFLFKRQTIHENQ